MKFTLFTQTFLAISAATGAIASPTKDTSNIAERDNCKLTIRYDRD
ncbi:hypothetical protein FVEN_g13128 [Fusarium venenatum]|nr:hypothetical protein FVEN_g13128 [Fusarium venenatum]